MQQEKQQQRKREDHRRDQGQIHYHEEAFLWRQNLQHGLEFFRRLDDAGSPERILDDLEQLVVEAESDERGHQQCHGDAHDHFAQVFEVIEKRFFLIAFAAEIHGDFFANFEDFLKKAGPHGNERRRGVADA